MDFEVSEKIIRFIKMLSIILFVVLIIFVPIFYYTAKAANKNNASSTLDIDLDEKRDLEEFKFTNLNELPNNFEKFFNDHIPFRSRFIVANRNVDSFLQKVYTEYIESFILNIGRKPAKKVVQYDNMEKPMDRAVKIYTGHTLADNEIDKVDDSIEYPLKVKGKAIMGKNNWLFFDSNNIPYYTGTNVLSEKKTAEYIKKLEDFDKLCEDNGKKVIYLMIPEKERIYNELMPTLEIEDPEGKIQKIKNSIATDSNVKYLFPTDVLKERKKDYRLYGKYDTHYTNAGAYVIHNEILKALGREVIDIDDINLDKKGPVIKDLTILAGLNPDSFMDDFDYNIYYKEDINTKLSYEDKAKQDVNCWVHIYESDTDDGEYILYYGDSFKEKMRPILSKDFSKSYFMSHLSRKDKTFEKAINESNIIVLENVERNEDSVFLAKITEITRILKKNQSKTITKDSDTKTDTKNETKKDTNAKTDDDKKTEATAKADTDINAETKNNATEKNDADAKASATEKNDAGTKADADVKIETNADAKTDEAKETKEETVKAETTKTETVKEETTKEETIKIETTKIETTKAETTKVVVKETIGIKEETTVQVETTKAPETIVNQEESSQGETNAETAGIIVGDPKVNTEGPQAE